MTLCNAESFLAVSTLVFTLLCFTEHALAVSTLALTLSEFFLILHGSFCVRDRILNSSTCEAVIFSSSK